LGEIAVCFAKIYTFLLNFVFSKLQNRRGCGTAPEPQTLKGWGTKPVPQLLLYFDMVGKVHPGLGV
jgi:hypothetical protein